MHAFMKALRIHAVDEWILNPVQDDDGGCVHSRSGCLGCVGIGLIGCKPHHACPII